MGESTTINLKGITVSIVVGLIVCLILLIQSLQDRDTRLIFCNVGQGDAAYMRIQNSFDVLIDAGPNRSILDCLGKHMPFHDRNIELVFISHPQADHIGGLLPVSERYRVGAIIGYLPPSTSTLSAKLKRSLDKQHTRIIPPAKDMRISFLNGYFQILSAPDRSSYADIQANESSVVLLYNEKNTSALFTGDATVSTLYPVQTQLLAESHSPLSLLKVPHHGSRTGLDPSLSFLAESTYSVISVKRSNSYGHPDKSIISLLQSHGSQLLRTDVQGDITFHITSHDLQLVP